MKKLVLLIVLLSIIVSLIKGKPLDYSQRVSLADKCFTRTGMSKAKVDESILHRRIISDDLSYPKFLTCYYRGQGFQKDNGDIVPSAIKDMLKDYTTLTKAQKDFVVNDCASIAGKTPSEKAYNTLECIMGRLGQVYYESSIENNEIDS